MARLSPLLVTVALSMAVGCGGWEKYENAEWRFRCEFGDQPTVTESAAAMGDWGDSMSASAATPESLFGHVSARRHGEFHADAGPGEMTPERWFDGMRSADPGYLRFRLNDVASGGVKGFEALEVKMEDAGASLPDESDLDAIYALGKRHDMKRVRYYVDEPNRRVWVVSLLANQGEAEALRGSSAEHFFEAFAILPEP